MNFRAQFHQDLPALEFSACLSKEGCIERSLEAIKYRARVVSAAAWGRGPSGKSCFRQRVNGRGRLSACPKVLVRHEGLPHQTFNEPNYTLVFSPTSANIYPPASPCQVPGPASEEGAWLAGQPWGSPCSSGLWFPSLKRGGWAEIIS